MTLERTAVMQQWTTRRCELPVMTAAAFFKPDTDPRTATAFAIDNFQFCIKSYIDSFMNLFMAPIHAIFGQHLNAAGVAMDSVNTVRTIAKRLYDAFTTYVAQYFRRFNVAVYEISRIIQYLRMGINRGIAVAVSSIYAGIAMFRTMINTIQFVIKVVLIVCTILLILIILLFFVLFPAIPVILGTLAAIIALVVAMTSIIPGSIANDANDKKSGFCFAAGTLVRVQRADGTIGATAVQDLRNGDQLAEGAGRVTAVITMNGKGIPLYQLDGVYVSGTHLVKGLDGRWKAVAHDVRATATAHESTVLYCFNTTSNTIPVCGKTGTVWCRDWEEIGNEDTKGQFLWNYVVSRQLHPGADYSVWRDNLREYVNVAAVGKDTLIKTVRGWVKIQHLRLHDRILDQTGQEQTVEGVVVAEVENAVAAEPQTWKTELYEWTATPGAWIKGVSTVQSGNDVVEGMALITERGDFILWDNEAQKEVVARDFTEVGYSSIHQTYAFVESRLRFTESP
jgi:hypothetical protein